MGEQMVGAEAANRDASTTDASTTDASTTDASTASESSGPKPYPFSVMRIIGTSIRVTKSNLVPFFLLACVLELPAFLMQLTRDANTVLLSVLVQQLTGALTTSVVAYGVIMELHGTRPSTRACITTGFRQIGRVLGVSIVSTLAIAGAMVLLVVPGIIVALMFYVVVPVAIFERLGIDAAMKRSRELTKGRKGDLFFMLAFAGGAAIAFQLVAQSGLGREALVISRGVWSAFTSMFFAVTAGVTYVELRKLHDGTQIPEIATAFARIRK